MHSLSRLLLRRGSGVTAAASGYLGQFANLHRDALHTPPQQPSSPSPSHAAQQRGADGGEASTPSPSCSSMMVHGRWIRSLVPLAWEQLLQQRFMSTASQQPEDPARQSAPAGPSGSSPTANGSTEHEERTKTPPLSQDVLYEGPLSKTHKMLKVRSCASLTQCSLMKIRLLPGQRPSAAHHVSAPGRCCTH